MYEHSVRVPFFATGPGVEAPQRLTTPIYLQDVMPTTLELAGVERPAHVQFQSLLPILREGKASKYDAIYGAYLGLQRMVTQDGWKLIAYPEAGVVRLYHVAEDPHELRDLAADPAQGQRVQQLFSKLQALQRELEDPLDLAVAFPKLAGSGH
jgi:choline-sulfatase